MENKAVSCATSFRRVTTADRQTTRIREILKQLSKLSNYTPEPSSQRQPYLSELLVDLEDRQDQDEQEDHDDQDNKDDHAENQGATTPKGMSESFETHHSIRIRIMNEDTLFEFAMLQGVNRMWWTCPGEINILSLDQGQAYVVGASAILPGDNLQEKRVFHNLAVSQKAVSQPTFKSRNWSEYIDPW
ncbi:hypothetical protein BGZ65_010704 [Modicella reniformis]|uniref:Uncharacterized protein n=1 Tax=Modicella reniformis TaxID=1440133 RepID=A0A9P6IRR9_9FUNG|nr:hypothetical protein BGZ65_010704 [Modicella reniformis]